MIGKINRYDQILTKIAFSNKLIDKTQLAKAYSIQKKLEESGEKNQIDEIFLKYKMISEKLIEELRTATKRSFSKGFGSRAVKKGFATTGQIEIALDLQAVEFQKTYSCRFIGEIMVEQGMITEDQRQVLLEEMENIEKKMVGREPVDISNKQVSENNKNSEEQFLDQEEKTEDQIAENNVPEPQGDSAEASIIELIVSQDKLEAKIIVSGDLSMAFTVDEVNDLLEDNCINYDLVDETKIEKFIKTVSKNNTELVVARGKKPTYGKDASITYFFDSDYLAAGRIDDDGTIDYKDRGVIPHIAVGDLLAEIVPLKEGKDGFDVYGESIPVPKPEDKAITCDSGVELSEDGLKAFAKIEGQPNVTVTGKLSVFDEFYVKGDVDYNTGNIEFDGNINVEGVVKDGFSVKGGNLTAKEIHKATIHLKGDLIVNGGIFGASIQTEGQVIAKYVKDANIKSYRDVLVDMEILDSKIRTSGKCIVERGKIISSLVTAKGGIAIKDIGTDVSSPCTIKVGIDEHIGKIIQGLDFKAKQKKEELWKLQAEYDNLLEEQKELHKKLSELSQTQNRIHTLETSLLKKMEELKAQKMEADLLKVEILFDKIKGKTQEVEERMGTIFLDHESLVKNISASMTAIEECIGAIEKVNKEKADILEWSKKGVVNPVIVVLGSIYSGTKIFGPNSLATVKETEKNVTIKEIQFGESEKAWKIEIMKGGGASTFK